MIASPGDVLEERNTVRDIIHEWNHVHSASTGAVLIARGWDTHSAPDLSDRPQELINKQVLKDCDLLVGIFWTKLGTPTGKAASGTVEEIESHVGAGKPAMVYFSDAPVAPASLDAEQFDALQEFKCWCQKKGLIATYDNILDFREKFRQQLGLQMNQNEYLSGLLSSQTSSEPVDEAGAVPGDVDVSPDAAQLSITTSPPSLEILSLGLSEEAQQLLLEAVLDKGGTIIDAAHIGGRTIQTNSKTFGDSGDRRSMARWEFALMQLLDQSLVVGRGHKGEIYEVTEAGYQVAEDLMDAGA